VVDEIGGLPLEGQAAHLLFALGTPLRTRLDHRDLNPRL